MEAIILTMAKYIVILFGTFIISVGLLMLLTPKKARETLQLAGSTNVINYTEITIRFLIALALIFYADFSKIPEAFSILGWFMLITSLILYGVPRKLHHQFSLKSAEKLKPLYFQWISPFAFVFGGFIIYNTL